MLSQLPILLRPPGERFLSAPKAITPYAATHRDFAWLSVAAYGATPAGRTRAAREARRRRTLTAPDGRIPLRIDRVYERGEILALLRSLINLIYRPTRRHPAIRAVRYSLFYGWSPIADHSIVRLANKIDRAVNPS